LRDRSRVDVNESWELRYWSDKFGVSHETLKGVVKKVGDRVEDVEREIKGGAAKR
jgi:hypothetical protein